MYLLQIEFDVYTKLEIPPVCSHCGGVIFYLNPRSTLYIYIMNIYILALIYVTLFNLYFSWLTSQHSYTKSYNLTI